MLAKLNDKFAIFQDRLNRQKLYKAVVFVMLANLKLFQEKVKRQTVQFPMAT